MLVPGTPKALRLHVTGSPKFPRSIASSAVITFVVDAIGRGVSALWLSSTRPDDSSMMMHAFALVATSSACARGISRRTSSSVRRGKRSRFSFMLCLFY